MLISKKFQNVSEKAAEFPSLKVSEKILILCRLMKILNDLILRHTFERLKLSFYVDFCHV